MHGGLGSSAFARRYWRNHYCFLFLWVLRWFTSPRCLLTTYGFSGGFFGISQRGFPHSEIPGSKLICSSPGLIAAYRVLHRLLAPRHSPYALSSLTIRNSDLHLLFLCARSSRAPRKRRVSPCTLRVCGRKNYRLQDIQLSKISCSALSGLAGSLHSRGPKAPLRSLAILSSGPKPRAWSLKPNEVENTGLEPVTSWLQTRRSPS